jgi:hypothetical protein
MAVTRTSGLGATLTPFNTGFLELCVANRASKYATLFKVIHCCNVKLQHSDLMNYVFWW